MSVPATNQPGIFVVIEGVDGAGKTTIAQKLVGDLNADTDFLEKHGYAGAIYLREPGSTAFGDAVRQQFLNPPAPLAVMTEVLALMACKSQLMEQEIKPAVYKGWIVICDRYTRTLLAYQGGMRGVPYETIVNLLATSGLLIPPNLEIFLSVPAEVSAERRGSDINSFDALAREHADDLRRGFKEGLRALPRYHSVELDASPAFDIVYEKVLSEVKRNLKLHRVSGRTLPEPILSFTPEPDPVLLQPTSQDHSGEPDAPDTQQEETSEHDEYRAGDGAA